MENDDTKNSPRDTSGDLSPIAPEEQTAKQQRQSSRQSKKTNQYQKKTLRQYWKSAKPLRQLEIGIAAVIAAGGVAYVVVAVCGLFQTRWMFQSEQRPRITAGAFTVVDTITKQYGISVGHPFLVDISLTNVGKSAALHVYIHRHVLFGKHYPMLKIEPPDTKRISQTIEPSSPPMITSAVSVVDTYKVESLYVAPDSFLPWDGTTPIVVFGRVTYEDANGTIYCTPFGAAYLDGQTFANLSDFTPQKISVTDLCPPGTVQ